MSAEPQKTRRSGAMRRSAAVAWAFGLSLAAGLVLGLIVGLTREGFLPAAFLQPWVIALVVAFVLVISTLASLAWWRSIDELARKAHETAWLWGGSIGMLGGWILLAFPIVWPPAFAGLAQAPPEHVAFYGGATVVCFALVGYGLVWAVFWWRRR